METPPLTMPTIWAQKERNGLLAQESPELREKRLLAEDPNATASALTCLADEVESLCLSNDAANPKYPVNLKHPAALLAEAIVSHPNTPLDVLHKIMDYGLPLGVLALMNNPIAPFFEWERPGFWDCLEYETCGRLLREAALPPVIRSAVEQSADESHLLDEARLHVSQTSPLQTPKAGNQAVTKYWQNYCRRRTQTTEAYFYDWYAELVELELSPPCLTPLLPVAPPRLFPIPKRITAFHDRAEAEKEWYHYKPRLVPVIGTQAFDDLMNYLLRYHAAPVDLREAVCLLTAGKTTQKTKSIKSQWFERIVTHRSITAEILTDATRFLFAVPTHDNTSHFVLLHSLTPTDVLIGLINDTGRLFPLETTAAQMRRLACRHPNAPPDARKRAREAFIKSSKLDPCGDSLIRFLDALRPFAYRGMNASERSNAEWDGDVRLGIALSLPFGNAFHVPFSDDPWERTPHEFMQHLACDGNVFVRWAAQMRLADPHFVFAWDENENAAQSSLKQSAGI